MHYIIGTDEAGYGPSLGPLVISATAWSVPGPIDDEDLRVLLSGVFSSAEEAAADRLAVDDSKKLYQPGSTLERLELPLLATLGSMNRQPDHWEDVWEILAPNDTPQLADEFWWTTTTPSWPAASQSSDIGSWIERIESVGDTRGVRCAEMQSTVIVPARFNELVRQHGNKATVLTRCTFELIRSVLERLEPGTCSIICDRHSGRTSYRPLLQDVFTDHVIEVWEEGPAGSRYRWGGKQDRTEIQFLTGGESHLPVAMASMASKYLRELAMQQFNSFWTSRIDGLRPTAGYPVDAKRFRKDVESARQELAIEDDQFWRCR